VRGSIGRCGSGALLAALLQGLSCATTEPVEVPPAVNVCVGALSAGSEPPRGGNIGLQVETNESNSLERLEVLPGVRVQSVLGGGPADLAGVKQGDVVLSVNDTPVSRPDAFEALAQGAPPGGELRLEARRDTIAFEAKVMVGPPVRGAPPVELYRADPVKLRAGFRTVTLEGPGARRTAAEVVKLFPGSPLAGAEIVPGDRILSLSGVEISSAEDLVRRVLEDHEFGDRVTLELRRGEASLTRQVRLWAPRRHLTKLVIPILFNYEWHLTPRRTQWALLDFWLFSFFEVRREEGEKEVRFLSLFRFRSGFGELVEEPREGKEAR
jgi:serine protease Do